jgi:hypothetical protein
MDNNSIIIDARFLFHNGFYLFKNIHKLNIYKKYILCNLPKVVTHPNELYIYIRSGDIFLSHEKRLISFYSQPPFCFYIKILEKFKFSKVFIISEDKINPVIPKLLNKYSYIKKKKNNIKLDISYLTNSYNIVAAKSTFFSTCIKLNDKFKFLWEYDFYSIKSAYLEFHYSFYKFPIYYTIYIMNSSTNYRKLMIPWINSPRQRKRMIDEKCINNFEIIRQ